MHLIINETFKRGEARCYLYALDGPVTRAVGSPGAAFTQAIPALTLYLQGPIQFTD